jgi:hypothetical protein
MLLNATNPPNIRNSVMMPMTNQKLTPSGVFELEETLVHVRAGPGTNGGGHFTPPMTNRQQEERQVRRD